MRKFLNFFNFTRETSNFIRGILMGMIIETSLGIMYLNGSGMAKLFLFISILLIAGTITYNENRGEK